MIDCRPAAIVRAAGAADVIQAVDFAARHELLLAVRGGGHNIAGKATCDGGLLLDLSAMRSVRVDRGEEDRAGRARGAAVGLRPRDAGVRPVDADGHQLDDRHGGADAGRRLRLAEPQARPHHRQPGLGRRRARRAASSCVASAKKHPDLFWAIRGGGGNFGVVTSFEYKLHQLGPEVLAGLVVYPMAQAADVFAGYRAFTAGAPDEMTAWLVLRKAPPLPFLPASAHGKPVVVVAFCWIGGPRKGKPVVAPLHKFGKPLGVHAGPMPFAGWQTAFDPLLAPGARNYWKSHDFKAVAPALEGDPAATRSQACPATSARSSSATWAARSTAWRGRDGLPAPRRRTTSSTCTRAGASRRTTRGASPGRASTFDAHDAARDRRRVRQLHARGRGGARRRRCVRGEPRPAGGAQGEVRPDEPVPAQPEHSARA